MSAEVGRFQVIDVSTWPIASIEPRGAEEKTWLEEPFADGGEPRRWLFKPITTHDWGDQGEDWAEKITAEIGCLLGVPCAQVELAVRHGERGLISLDLAPRPLQLFTGMLVMPAVVADYQVGADRVAGRPGHSLFYIEQALDGCVPPPGSNVPVSFGAFDVFVGYLMLDALVANRDRHDENWAILRHVDPSQPDMLCGAYDHGSTLGYNLRDAARQQKLNEGRVGDWVRRGTAWRFEYATPPGPATLVELAAEGLKMSQPATRDHWLDRLRAVGTDDLVNVVVRVPGMSDPSRSFALEVLQLNRERVLSEC